MPGTPSNIPTGSPVATAGPGDADESSDSTINYEIPKTVATITEPVGGVKRLSVAVVLDNAVRPSAQSGSDAPQSVPRSDEEMKKLTELVRAAIGFDEKRGDALTVANLAFDSGPIEEQKRALSTAERTEFWYRVGKYPSLVVGALLAFLFVVRPILRSIRTALSPREPAVRVEAPALADAPDTPALTLRRRLIEISASEPEGAAQVVRGWLREKS